jgi:hypothetical protein
MLKWIIIAAISMAIVSSEAAAEPQAGLGIGFAPCSVFNQTNAKDPDWAKNNYLSWAQGFMSGANDKNSDANKPLTDVSAMSFDDQWTYLKAFCAANPSRIFFQGVYSLYMSLPTYTEKQ